MYRHNGALGLSSLHRHDSVAPPRDHHGNVLIAALHLSKKKVRPAGARGSPERFFWRYRPKSLQSGLPALLCGNLRHDYPSADLQPVHPQAAESIFSRCSRLSWASSLAISLICFLPRRPFSSIISAPFPTFGLIANRSGGHCHDRFPVGVFCRSAPSGNCCPLQRAYRSGHRNGAWIWW